MNIRERIRAAVLSSSADGRSAPAVSGHWQSISMCFDEDTREFFNVGVIFKHGSTVEVRMLDSFERVTCIFDDRINKADLGRLMNDIESTLIQFGSDLPSTLGDTIRLGSPLYASGSSAEAVVDSFFDDVVTLGRPRPGTKDQRFRYKSTPKLRSNVIDLLNEKLELNASKIIMPDRYIVNLGQGNTYEADIPLMSSTAAGCIVSGWYKSSVVVENNILRASADLNIVRTATSRKEAAISILTPGVTSGMGKKDLAKVQKSTEAHLDRVKASGIYVLEASNTNDLADMTADWWRSRSA